MYPLVNNAVFSERLSYSRNQIICVSNAVECKYKTQYNLTQIRTIYNGIDRTPFTRNQNEKLDSEKVRILISGMINEAKGQIQAVKAVNQLILRGLDNIELFIAGNGDVQELQKSSMQFSEHFHYLGQVADMASLRKKMDLELVCSRCEAFGRVTAEAMMSGIPVIGSNTGGTPELINDGNTGFLYKYNDIDDLAEKIEILVKNRELRVKIGINAHKYAEEHFLIDNCVCNIEKVYDEMLSKKKR